MTLVYADATAAALFWATYLVFVLLDARLIVRSLARRALGVGEPVRGMAHRPSGLVAVVAAEVVGLAAASVEATVLPWRWTLLVLGLALAWAGVGLRWGAKRALGHFFVGAIVIQADHRVVTHGPYAIVRHPGYAGSWLALTGLGIATGNVLTILLLTAVPAYVFVRTIQLEEAALLGSLPQEYDNYRKRTSRLIPHLW